MASYEKPFSALLAGVSDRLKKKYPIGALTPAERIDGKTCLITGANSGLGKAIAVELARRGGRVVMACRGGHPAAGESVKQKSGSRTVEMARIDLTDFDSITEFCEEMKAQNRYFDIAVLNAGIVAAGARRTKQGFEEMFGVNYLANFFLVTRLLRDGTIPNSVFTGWEDETADHEDVVGSDMSGSTRIPRIVFVSSEAHRSIEPIDFTTFGHFRNYAKVVRDQQNRCARILFEPVDKFQNLGLNGNIQGSRRLIGNDQFGVAGKRHGNHDSLAHSAAHLMRIFPGAFGRIRNPDFG